MRKTTRALVATVLSIAAAALFSFGASAEEEGHDHAHASAPHEPHARFSRDTIDVFARLPVQEGGRVKPFSTYANFTLLALNGVRSVKTPSGEKLEPTEWLMDCLFFPEQAMTYDCFLVQDDAVLDDLGLEHEGKSRRDRYSWNFLQPAFPRLEERLQEYERIDPKERGSVETQVVNLGHNLMQFSALMSYLDGVLQHLDAAASPTLTKAFGQDAHPSLADILERADEIAPALAGGDPHASGDPHGAGNAEPALSGWARQVVSSGRGFAILPPPGAPADNAEWLSPGGVAAEVLFHGAKMPDHVAALRDLQAMYASRDNASAFHGRAESYRERVVGLAEGRGEYRKVPLEVTFYRTKFFFYAQIAFVLSFLLVAFSWIKPTKVLPHFATGALAGGTLLLVAGITIRCIIRGRPPVSTLYETILFITAVGVIVAMATEYINRKGIALSLATVLGSAGMFLADRYEMQERVDTMPSLVAVLDTNFWLATHVTTVTIGYGAGLLAGAIGHVYVLGKVFGLKKGDTAFYKTLSTMTYGMLCFGLLFSIVGTVLGGIWANDSWGRFWGWDPKENGALLIVLWELIVLHARMAGYVKDFGVAMMSVFGAAVVASSWWGVNLLGVGLHSYGFTSGILWTLLGYYAVEAAVLAAGGLYLVISSHAGSTNASPPAP
jgi:ABC-type transport system involved in cytochrome c biogenesis permease subunit